MELTNKVNLLRDKSVCLGIFLVSLFAESQFVSHLANRLFYFLFFYRITCMLTHLLFHLSSQKIENA